MILKDIVAVIDSIEEEFAIWNIKYENIEIWPIIRMELAETLYNASMESEIEKTPYPSKKNVRRYLGDLYWTFKTYNKAYNFQKKNVSVDKSQNIRRPYKADFLFYELSSHRTITVNNKFFNRIADSLHLFLEEVGTIFHAESVVNYLVYPRYNKTFLIDHLLVKFEFFRAIKSRILKRSATIENLDHFLSYLSTKNVKMISKQNIILRCEKMVAYSDFFKQLFSRVKPKLLLLDIFYHDKAMAAIYAARQLKIPSVDIQHGMQGFNHHAYSKWNIASTSGTDLLPDYFWVWDYESFNALNAWSGSMKLHKPILGGHPLLTAIKNNKIPVNLPLYFADLLKDKKCRILVSLGMTSEIDIVYLKEIAAIIDQNQKEIFWTFRCHPDYIAKNKEAIHLIFDKQLEIQSNINIHTHEEINLYGLLKHINIHITTVSSICIEAAFYGIANIIMGPEGYSYYTPKILSGAFHYAETHEELLNLIQSNIENKKSEKDNLSADIDIIREKIKYLLNKKDHKTVLTPILI